MVFYIIWIIVIFNYHENKIIYNNIFNKFIQCIYLKKRGLPNALDRPVLIIDFNTLISKFVLKV